MAVHEALDRLHKAAFQAPESQAPRGPIVGGENCGLNEGEDPFALDPEEVPICQEAWFDHMEQQKESLDQVQKWQGDVASLLSMMKADLEGFTGAQRRKIVKLHRTQPYPTPIY